MQEGKRKLIEQIERLAKVREQRQLAAGHLPPQKR